ncbi:NUDIX domain-containing protein [Kitasatospora sp. NPDC056783]|uniref:NUDIX domain-containing protein n=1 Tax=Kitasatospora sp. NPDC056783 TaxID=3345943 RepID=UPI003683ED33
MGGTRWPRPGFPARSSSRRFPAPCTAAACCSSTRTGSCCSYTTPTARAGPPQRWWAPGGLLEGGEAPEQAARREVLEETGVLLDGPLVPVGVDFLPPAEDWPPVSTYFFSTGPLTWEQVASVTLSEAHDEPRFRELADWNDQVSATIHARLTGLVTAFATESQVVLHCGRRAAHHLETE